MRKARRARGPSALGVGPLAALKDDRRKERRGDRSELFLVFAIWPVCFETKPENEKSVELV